MPGDPVKNKTFEIADSDPETEDNEEIDIEATDADESSGDEAPDVEVSFLTYPVKDALKGASIHHALPDPVFVEEKDKIEFPENAEDCIAVKTGEYGMCPGFVTGDAKHPFKLTVHVVVKESDQRDFYKKYHGKTGPALTVAFARSAKKFNEGTEEVQTEMKKRLGKNVELVLGDVLIKSIIEKPREKRKRKVPEGQEDESGGKEHGKKKEEQKKKQRKLFPGESGKAEKGESKEKTPVRSTPVKPGFMPTDHTLELDNAEIATLKNVCKVIDGLRTLF